MLKSKPTTEQIIIQKKDRSGNTASPSDVTALLQSIEDNTKRNELIKACIDLITKSSSE